MRLDVNDKRKFTDADNDVLFNTLVLRHKKAIALCQCYISDVKRLNRLIQLTAKDINSKKYLQLSMDK